MERTVLFGAVAGSLETFLAGLAARDRVVPRFVERELRAYLQCGIPAFGFLRVHCDACATTGTCPGRLERRGRCRVARRLPWAQLLSRVFAVDALTCHRCGQPMRVLAAIQSPQAIRAILECLGLPSRAPPIAPPALVGLLPADP